jgi:hypothetical protein
MNIVFKLGSKDILIPQFENFQLYGGKASTCLRQIVARELRGDVIIFVWNS